MKTNRSFFDKTNTVQRLLAHFVWKTGYTLEALVNAVEIQSPGPELWGTWKISTDEHLGFSINISKKDVEILMIIINGEG